MAILEATSTVVLPRVTIKFCTQCKWMLRAAYFAQELLSTFSTSLGEVSLIPSTGGVFTVDITHRASSTSSSPETPTLTQLWDRKTNGGFPEIKHLKQLVRNVIDPERDLGHVDRHHGGKEGKEMRKEGESGIQGEVKDKGDDGEFERIRTLAATNQSTESDDGSSATAVEEVGSKDDSKTGGKQKEYCKDCN